jgi:phosphopantetheinyl transferase
LPHSDLGSLLARLPYGKRLELERRSPAERAAGLAGIALALEAARRLRGATVPAANLSFPQDGKPAFDGGPYFSVSHTDGCVACAASDAFDCGFDFEFVPIGADAAARSRLRRWTAVEAVLKAAGHGLRESAQVEIAADHSTGRIQARRYHLREIDLGPLYVAHLATPEEPSEIRIERVLTTPAPPAP